MARKCLPGLGRSRHVTSFPKWLTPSHQGKESEESHLFLRKNQHNSGSFRRRNPPAPLVDKMRPIRFCQVSSGSSLIQTDRFFYLSWDAPIKRCSLLLPLLSFPSLQCDSNSDRPACEQRANSESEILRHCRTRTSILRVKPGRETFGLFVMAQHKPGLMEKIKDKLPGHHHVPDLSGEETEETVHRISDGTDSTETPVTARSKPHLDKKKSMVQKIKERLSGNHGKGNSGAKNAYDAPAPKDNSDPVEKNLTVDDNNRGAYGQKAAEKVIRPGMARNKSF